MAITKSLRFEVFKRDAFQCQYCGKKPPEIILHIDHIIPKKLQGIEQIENLITACADCNLGKGARRLSVMPQDMKKRIDDLKEREEQIEELYKYQKLLRKRKNADLLIIQKELQRLEKKPDVILTDFGRKNIDNLLNKFDRYEIIDAIRLTWDRKPGLDLDEKFRYTCGILWRSREEWKEHNE